MSDTGKKTSARLDPRAPLVIDTHELPRRPGSMRRLSLNVPAPEQFSLDVCGVPQGSDIALELRLESVMDGVLVSGQAQAHVTGECSRCLEPVEFDLEVDVQELYVYPGEEADDETGRLEGDLLDFEPALRDAVVFALPFAPVCREDCPGLCPTCGERLASVGPDHHHDAVDARWAALEALQARTTETQES
jgi:uncharacterized protein